MRTLLPILVVSAMALTGCAFDHRKDVAYGLLYRPDGLESDKVFLAAASAKFPPGTAAGELEKFATSYQGKCSMEESGGVVCEIPTRGHFCAVRLIRIQAIVESGVIKSIGFHSGGIGC